MFLSTERSSSPTLSILFPHESVIYSSDVIETMADSNNIKGSGGMGILAVALVLVLAAASLVVIVPPQSDDASSLAATSGTCGDGVVWSYSDWTWTLTISYTGEGSGRMDDYERVYYGEFHGIKNIKTLIIGDGVTYIGRSCFADITSIETLIISDTVTEIGGYAFWMGGSPAEKWSTFNENTLKNVTWGKNIKIIGMLAFRNVGIRNVSLPSAERLEYGAFDDCWYLESMDLPSIKYIENVGYQGYLMRHLSIGSELEYVDWSFMHTNLRDMNGNLLEHTADNLRGRTFDGEPGSTLTRKYAELRETGTSSFIGSDIADVVISDMPWIPAESYVSSLPVVSCASDELFICAPDKR